MTRFRRADAHRSAPTAFAVGAFISSIFWKNEDQADRDPS